MTPDAFTLPQWLALLGFVGGALTVVVGVFRLNAWLRSRIESDVLTVLDSPTGRQRIEAIAILATRGDLESVLGKMSRIEADLARFTGAMEKQTEAVNLLREEIANLRGRLGRES